MNFSLPRDLDRAEVREFHAPRLVDCRWPTCPARRGEHCLTPAGAFAPYHRPRIHDTNAMADEELVAGFDTLGGELAARRAERDAAMRRPLTPEVIATRDAIRVAWDRIGREVLAAERRGGR